MTQYVTLSYGGSTFANVDNLKAGEPRLAGSVLLKADTNDGTVFPYARFDVCLQDQSEGKVDTEAKLIDLLQVDIYEGKAYKLSGSTNLILKEMILDDEIEDAEDFAASLLEHGTLYTLANDVATSQTEYASGKDYYYTGSDLDYLDTVPVSTTPSYVKDTSVVSQTTFDAAKKAHGKLFIFNDPNYLEVTTYTSGKEYYYDENKEVSIPVTIPSGDGLYVSAVVSLDATTDAKVLEQISKDVVYLQMNLNKDPNPVQPYVESTKVYVNKTASGAETKCIAMHGHQPTKTLNGLVLK